MLHNLPFRFCVFTLCCSCFISEAMAVADVSTTLITPSSERSDHVNGSGVTITVQARNALDVDEVAGGETIALTSTVGSLTAVTDNGDGTYTATLTHTSEGEAIVSGTIGGVDIVDTATINFFQINGSSDNWVPVFLGGGFDPGNDLEVVAGPAIDIVGSADDAAMYTVYDGGLTPNDVSDDKVCYRVRVGGSSGGAFENNIWIGVNVDTATDGDYDFYIRVDGNGATGGSFSGTVTVFDAGADLNIAPISSDVANGVQIVSLTDGTDFSFDQIGGTPNPDPSVSNNDINADAEADYMLSYCVDWTDLRDVVNTKPLKDPAPATISIDKDTLLTFILSSSNDGSALNADYAGYAAGDSLLWSYVDQSAESPRLTFSNIYPVISVPSASINVNDGTSNLTVIIDADATDADGDTLTYSLTGDDAADFTIDSDTGEIRFAAVADFDTPVDADTNNIYLITVNVSDGKGGTDTEDLTITVIDGDPVVDVSHAGTLIEATDSDGDADTPNSGAIRVTLNTSHGVPVANVRATFVVASGSATLTTATGTTDVNGQFSTTVSNTVAETATFTVQYDSDDDNIVDTAVTNGSPASVTFAAGAADSSNSTLSVTTNNQVANGTDENEVQATVLDTNSNPVAGELVSFSATNSADVDASCTTDASGQCSVDITSTVVGISAITATIVDGELSNSPLNVTFVVGPTTDSDGDGVLDILEGGTDTDGDGDTDAYDVDSDGDGIPDRIESGVSGNDTDGDGIDDSYDVDQTGGTDANTDGVDDNVLHPDNDSDGVIDYLDIDSDDDGIPDVLEGSNSTDTDGDGVDDYYDVDQTGGVDNNNDGYDDNVGAPDTDGDGTPDYLDIDTDSDGILDEVEAGLSQNDADADGVDDQLDADVTAGTDNNGDGILEDTLNDQDGDGIDDYRDLDSDNDSILDVIEAGLDDDDGNGLTDNNSQTTTPTDSDSDGNPDYLETDSDGDGVDDIDDIGNGFLDTNNDGRIDDATDNENDGIADIVDGNPNAFGTALNDTDNDGVSDWLDLDDDNDGISDIAEGNGDQDSDGVVDRLDPDADNDGYPDYRELGADVSLSGVDSNGNGFDDAFDVEVTGGTDSNLDGADDRYEPVDTDEDGTPDYKDTDSDNDGVPDAEEISYLQFSGIDSDGDGIDDTFDVDATGGVDANSDGFDDARSTAVDTDGDGIFNHLEIDSDDDSYDDLLENGDFNNDGILDRLQKEQGVISAIRGAGSFYLFMIFALSLLTLRSQVIRRKIK